MNDTAPDRPTRAQVDAVPHKAAALLLAAARPDPTLRTAARQVQDALIALDDEVRALRADHEPYEVLAPQSCAAGEHPEWLIDSEHSHACPWCQIEALRAALAARTPQPAEPLSWLSGAAPDETARVVADVKEEAVWLVLHMQANGTRKDIQSALRTLRLVWGDPPLVEQQAAAAAAPLPAVPDGEDEAPRRRWVCDADPARVAHTNFTGWTPCSQCRVIDGAPDGEDVPARLDAAAEALEVSQWFGSAANLRAVASALRDRAASHDRAAVAAALARPTGGQE